MAVEGVKTLGKMVGMQYIFEVGEEVGDSLAL